MSILAAFSAANEVSIIGIPVIGAGFFAAAFLGASFFFGAEESADFDPGLVGLGISDDSIRRIAPRKGAKLPFLHQFRI
jgi:hypothetical protein